MRLNPGAKTVYPELSMNLSTDPQFFALLAGSFARLLKKPLVPAGADAAWLYEDAPFAVLAHGPEADPKFIYANKAAQACFGYSFDEFLTLPSRLSAEAADRAARQALLAQVAKHGFVAGYRGLRVAKSGRRFIIEDGILWELIDAAGVRHGQAATFSSWRDA